MSTAVEHHSLTITPASVSGGSLWGRIGTVIKAAWRRALTNPVPEVTNTVTRSPHLPVVGKVATISVAGKYVGTVRAVSSRTVPAKLATFGARRPGVQGRWKTTDRVAML